MRSRLPVSFRNPLLLNRLPKHEVALSSICLFCAPGIQAGLGRAVLLLHVLLLIGSVIWLHLAVAGPGWKVLEGLSHIAGSPRVVLSTGSLGCPHSMMAFLCGSWVWGGSVPSNEGRALKACRPKLTQGHFFILLVKSGHRLAQIQGEERWTSFLRGKH